MVTKFHGPPSGFRAQEISWGPPGPDRLKRTEEGLALGPLLKAVSVLLGGSGGLRKQATDGDSQSYDMVYRGYKVPLTLLDPKYDSSFHVLFHDY